MSKVPREQPIRTLGGKVTSPPILVSVTSPPAKRNSGDIETVASSADYRAFIDRLTQQVRSAQGRAARAVNTELITLYWMIGREIIDQQQSAGWGDDVVGRIAQDLALATNSKRGFSRRNLFYMRRFAQTWPTLELVQTVSALITWSQHQILLDAFGEQLDLYRWYAAKSVENHWEFFVDLIFYHHILRRFVVIELKTKKFQPEYASKMNFYLNAVDEQLRVEGDKESVGIILCTQKNETVAKVALHRMHAPIAVSTWRTDAVALPPVEITEDVSDDAELAQLENVREQLIERVSRRSSAANNPNEDGGV